MGLGSDGKGLGLGLAHLWASPSTLFWSLRPKASGGLGFRVCTAPYRPRHAPPHTHTSPKLLSVHGALSCRETWAFSIT